MVVPRTFSRLKNSRKMWERWKVKWSLLRTTYIHAVIHALMCLDVRTQCVFLTECLMRRFDNLQQFNISYNMYCIRTHNQKRREEEEEQRRRDRRTNEDYYHGGGIRESGAPPSNLILPTANERSRRPRLDTSGARIVVSDISGVEVARLGTARVRIATPTLFCRRLPAAPGGGAIRARPYVCCLFTFAGH